MAAKYPEQVGEIAALMRRIGITDLDELAKAAGINPNTMAKLAGGHQPLTEQKRHSLRLVEQVRTGSVSKLESTQAHSPNVDDPLTGLSDEDLIANAEKLFGEFKQSFGTLRYRKALSLSLFFNTIMAREVERHRRAEAEAREAALKEREVSAGGQVAASSALQALQKEGKIREPEALPPSATVASQTDTGEKPGVHTERHPARRQTPLKPAPK